MKSLMILSLLPLLGCATLEHGETVHVFVKHNQFAPDQYEMIHQAMDAWEEATDGYVRFVEVPSKGYDNLIVVNGRDHLSNEEEFGTAGVCIRDPGKIGCGLWLPNDVHDPRFLKMAIHEMGHGLGVGHLEEGGVMEQGSHVKPEITCSDLELFCEVHDCDHEDFSLCKPE